MNGTRVAAGGERNLDIEVLRCVAIVFTLLQHVHVLLPDPQAWLALVGKRLGFWTGVDLFFVVSGFVIMRNLGVLADRGAGRPSRRAVLAFWIKRAFRLLPTAWLWLLLPLLGGVALASSGWFPPPERMWQGALAAMLNVHNGVLAWCFAARNGFPACEPGQLSGHYWSLSLEEQFYVVLPLLLLVLPRRWLLPLAVAGIALLVAVPRVPFSPAWFFRIDGFLWGIALALCFDSRWYGKAEPRLLSRVVPRVLVVGGLLFALARLPTAAAGIGLDFSGPHRSWSLAAIALVGALLVWIASYDRGYLCGRGPWLPVLARVGALSYSLYVIHLPVFHVLNRAAPALGLGSGIALVVLAVALSLALAELNFRLVETPLRERGRRIAARVAGQPPPAC
jgi:peptidoglycan/LPS O-acetylase OafA/YrhL